MGFDGSTKITVNGVQCWDEGTVEDYGRTRDANVATRKLRIEWANRRQLVQALQSGSQQIGSVTIISGAQLYPGTTNQYVDGIHIDGEGALGTETLPGVGGLGAGQLVTYQWAVLSVKYTPLDFTVSQTELDFSSETLSLPREAIKFANGNPLAQGAALRVATVCLRQSRYNLPSLPVSTILAATAKPVNSTPIFGAAAGTILFDGGRSLSRYTLLTPTLYDISYAFLYKPTGWGKLFDPVSSSWQAIQTKDGTPVLDSSNLNLLFA